MGNALVASFEHFGIAPFEVEALFTILNGAFLVEERKVERDAADYASMIDIHFPIAFGDKFFDTFGRKRWNNITFLMKEMRRRTGKKGVILRMRFAGKPALTFVIAMREENLFEFALEKMEILNELIELQTSSERLPAGVDNVRYEFSATDSRWHPTMALGNDNIFKYEQGEWVISSDL
jgi:hypothetical protein